MYKVANINKFSNLLKKMLQTCCPDIGEFQRIETGRLKGIFLVYRIIGLLVGWKLAFVERLS